MTRATETLFMQCPICKNRVSFPSPDEDVWSGIAGHAECNFCNTLLFLYLDELPDGTQITTCLTREEAINEYQIGEDELDNT